MSVWNNSLEINYKLINFNVPKYLINNFDNLVRFKKVSRTSMLVYLIEDYLRLEQTRMENDNILNLMISKPGERNMEDLKKELRKGVANIRGDYEPPVASNSNDFDVWDYGIGRL